MVFNRNKYKQALRGLFTIGTSTGYSDVYRTTEKVDGKQRIESLRIRSGMRAAND